LTIHSTRHAKDHEKLLQRKTEREREKDKKEQRMEGLTYVCINRELVIQDVCEVLAVGVNRNINETNAWQID